jgi:homoserine kinase
MKPAFRAAPVHVRVPATSANLGPGYDALGLALSLFDDVVARVADDGLLVDVAGEGTEVSRDENHLIVRSLRAAFDRMGGQPRGLELSCANRIPHGRGLGSSAAAIVAGVVLARALVLGGDQQLPDEALLALASDLEGHPDNVAPCLSGGLTVAWVDSADHQARSVRLEPGPWLQPVLLVPPQQGSTHQARALLPATVSHADAAANAARAALLIVALTGEPGALLPATDDRLHQPYRAESMPESAGLMNSLRAAGVPAVISGAGPTVLALTRGDVEAELTASLLPAGWAIHRLAVDAFGAHVVPPTR